jgi:hypothetical protein
MRPFLTANWRYLAVLNYVVDPRLLAPFVPVGTEIDFRFNPCWDDLRGDKRFDKILAAAKAASK